MVGGIPHSAKPSGCEDLDVEEPVVCWYTPAFHFYPTLPRMLGSTLIRHQVIQVSQAGEKRLLAATRVMKAFHGEQLPLNGVVRLIEQRARHRHLRVFQDCIPARPLLLEPAPDACPVGGPSRRSDVANKTAQPLAQGKHAQALALARPVEQGVELRAQGLADRGRYRHKFGGQLIDRMAETVAEACTREQRPQALDGTVEAIDEDPLDLVRRLLLRRGALKLAIGLRKGNRTGILGIWGEPNKRT